MSPAEIIKSQLGNTTLATVGAFNLLSCDGGQALSFRLKAPNKKGVNYIKIKLEPSDTYSIEFWNLHNFRKMYVTDKIDCVYVDMLHDVIKSRTGLYTRF